MLKRVTYFFGALSLLFVSTYVFAQPLLRSNPSSATGTNTYAVVIGIAAYQDPDIPPLSFSNKDAVVFADFLMSAPGGSVPKQHIKLLTDSMATIGEVDKAIRWLMDNCQEGDKVFFYFSGHGEMENVTMSKNGYLICYNTPSVAFVNMGLSIDYLNDVVNTISVQTKAKVVVITDACHSGTMAGNKFKGNFFVGEQLMLKKQNEIRMASCKPDELSNEKVDWGGGRGVFSYYLINGLQGGLADKNKDQIVSVGELKNYMQSSMATDPVLKSDGDIQTPVINGNDAFALATVVESESKKIKEQVKNDSIIQVMVMSVMPGAGAEDESEPSDYFFKQLKKQNLEGVTDTLKLNSIAAENIAFALINSLKNNAATETGKNKLAELENILKNDKELHARFDLDIASAFLDIGLNVIANYIRGDEAELERRRYYNSKNNGYDVYTRMFAVALKLSKSDKYYSTKAEVFLHYFTGLALRLKIPLTDNQAPLIEQALAEQQKALALEEYAPYIYNELGVLYQYKKNITAAEKYYTKAAQLSPGWAIPQSNLSGIYLLKSAYSQALAYADKADSLQKNLQSAIINRGLINEKQGNLLFAEEDYHNAIDINSRHYLPFERLGYLNLNTANYAQADSFLYEADLRKKGYHFKGNGWDIPEPGIVVAPMPFFSCTVDTSILDPKDIFAFFTWGMQEYRQQKYANAVRILRKIVAVEKSNPLVYHYLGKIYYDQQKWEEAELMFKLAISFSKDTAAFSAYVDSVIRSKKYPYDHDCFENFFRDKRYRQVEDYYFAGTVYESWKHWEEAENYFRRIIHINSIVQYSGNGEQVPIKLPNAIEIDNYERIAAYVKLWQLLEKQGRFDETEAAITQYGLLNHIQADEELNEFYRRMVDRFPEKGDWHYRLGNLLYRYAPFTTRVPYFDSIVRFPFLNKELFIDFDIYANLTKTDSLALYDESETGEIKKVTLSGKLMENRRSYRVPGTGDYITAADLIYMPRKDGIAYLQKAGALLSEKETLADIHFKTGNIYVWAGSKKQAWPYFEKSLSLVPDNASARLTLVDIYKALYKNRSAFNQLNYLYDSNQINLQKRLILARFNIYAHNFDKANELMNKAENFTPYLLPEINDMRGLANMLANKPAQAILFYKESLKTQETIWYTDYSLARLYAYTNKTTEAWSYLQQAVKKGFNYSFVLQQDGYLENLRNSSKWQPFFNSIAIKKYKKKLPVN